MVARVKIASYAVTLRESYEGLQVEAWAREDGSLCLYILPLETMPPVTATEKSGEVVIVDWAGVDEPLRGEHLIGDPVDFPEVCTVPEPGAVSGIVAGLVLLLVLKMGGHNG